MAICKSVFEVVVLHDASHDLSTMSLERIGAEMNQGEFLGSRFDVRTVPVLRSDAFEQMAGLGNDGSFFELECFDEGGVQPAKDSEPDARSGAVFEL
jgi:hypothetical protein